MADCPDCGAAQVTIQNDVTGASYFQCQAGHTWPAGDDGDEG
jgi:hypothetical protein